MAYTNALRAKLGRGEPAVGVFFNVPSASVAEMVAVLGLDFIIVDCEHSPMTPETAEGIYRGAQLQGMTALTRIGENVQQHIQKYLDAGSEGVQIPLINSAQDAEAVVAAVKYPPRGKRGMAGPRLAGYGRTPPAEFIPQWNAESLVSVQIETREGIANFDEILATPGVDIVFFGPMDLSVVLGHPGETMHPEVVSVIERLGTKTVEAGKVAGTIMATEEQYRRYRDLGFLFCCTGVTAFLQRGAREYLAMARTYEDAPAGGR